MPPKGSRSFKTISKKKMDIRRNPKRLRLGAYNFTRYASATLGTGTTMTLSNLLTENGFLFIFALNQLRNFTDFTNLFDMYQINKVDLYFKLINNPDGQASTTIASNQWPVLWYVRDYDDGGILSSANMQEKQGAKRLILRPDVIQKISVVPKFQKMVYQTLTSTGYGPGSGFLDCVDNSVPHFALKTTVQVPNSGQDWYVECQAKYHVSFKGPQ